MAVSLPVLTFHELDDRPDPINFQPAVFRKGLARLKEKGFRSLPLDAAFEIIKEKKDLPESSLVITFDDGFRSVYTEAYPVLRENGFSATVFLTTGTRSIRPGERLPPHAGRPMLSWEEIREMEASGVDFGAHTLTHPELPSLSPREMEREILDSKRVIEDELSRPVTSFAYPFGLADRRSREIVREHFEGACSAELGLAASRSDPWFLERVETFYLRRQWQLELLTSSLFPWYLRARGVPRRIRKLTSVGRR
jgi:peptidoglycan/xylan/chitin deacetylase (PgdA/CDA1 family)